MKLKNQGFTLVEMMVVIVILGILSAVGVPKLFGQIAKSKAAELSPAAATYIKLQNAYVIERKQVGSWKRIGYSAPKSNNFRYDRGTLATQKLNSSEAKALGVGWSAKNLVSLAGCDADNEWTVTVSSLGLDANNNVRLEYKSDIVGSATSYNCVALASGWGSADGEQQLAAASPSRTPGDDSSPDPDPDSSTDPETPSVDPSDDVDPSVLDYTNTKECMLTGNNCNFGNVPVLCANGDKKGCTEWRRASECPDKNWVHNMKCNGW